MERTRREESLSFKEKMGRLLADARAGKRQLEYRDIFRYFRPKELKEEELDRVLDILAENQVQILDEGEEQDAGLPVFKRNWKNFPFNPGRRINAGKGSKGRKQRSKRETGKGKSAAGSQYCQALRRQGNGIFRSGPGRKPGAYAGGREV